MAEDVLGGESLLGGVGQHAPQQVSQLGLPRVLLSQQAPQLLRRLLAELSLLHHDLLQPPVDAAEQPEA